mmetsp:Transcript_24082/g.82348  ORF Transcript_24082/g.82348 Transcript_24082/m.82348 type:complete len:216 (-) Transcript_24082:1190-1837(-)
MSLRLDCPETPTGTEICCSKADRGDAPCCDVPCCDVPCDAPWCKPLWCKPLCCRPRSLLEPPSMNMRRALDCADAPSPLDCADAPSPPTADVGESNCPRPRLIVCTVPRRFAGCEGRLGAVAPADGAAATAGYKYRADELFEPSEARRVTSLCACLLRATLDAASASSAAAASPSALRDAASGATARSGAAYSAVPSAPASPPGASPPAASSSEA